MIIFGGKRTLLRAYLKTFFKSIQFSRVEIFSKPVTRLVRSTSLWRAGPATTKCLRTADVRSNFAIPGDLCDLNLFIPDQMDRAIGAITKLKVAEIGRGAFLVVTSSPLSRPRFSAAQTMPPKEILQMKACSALVGIAGCAIFGCTPAPHLVGRVTSDVTIANSAWTILSVSGDTLRKPGSTMIFKAKTFRAKLPCSVVVGSFVQNGRFLRTSGVRTISGSCQPTGAEKYFGGKLSSGQMIQPTATGIILQNPPDSIELARR